MRGKKTKSVFEMIKRMIYLNGSRSCAMVLIVSIIIGGIGHATIASAGKRDNGLRMEEDIQARSEHAPTTSERKNGLRLKRSSLYQSLQEALRNDQTLDTDMVFEGEGAEEYSELLQADVNLYELTPEIQGAGNGLNMRVFVRIADEVPLDSDYQPDGSEEFIFLLLNGTESDHETVIQVDERSTERIMIGHAAAVTVEDKADAAGAGHAAGKPKPESGGNTTGTREDAANITKETDTAGGQETNAADGNDEGEGQNQAADEDASVSGADGDSAANGESPAQGGDDNHIANDGSSAQGEDDNHVSDGDSSAQGQDDNPVTNGESSVPGEASAPESGDNGVSGEGTSERNQDDGSASKEAAGHTENNSGQEAGSRDTATISYRNLYRAMAVASPSDYEDKHTASDAEPEYWIEGTVYQTVLLNHDAVTAFVTTAEDLGLDEEYFNTASPSNATPANATPANGEYHYEVELDKVNIQVWAKAGVLPENAELRAAELEAAGDSEEKYQEAKTALAKDGTEYDGMLAYDISFWDEDDNELEPDGDVRVQITMNAGVLPEEADPESLLVQHHAETNKGIVVETVADVVDAAEGTVTVDDGEAVAKFMVGSFSIYTITWTTWSVTYFYVDLKYVDENGAEISIPGLGTSENVANVGDLGVEKKLNNYVKPMQGYTYTGAEYEKTPVTHFKFVIVTKPGTTTIQKRCLDLYNGNTLVKRFDNETNKEVYVLVHMTYKNEGAQGIRIIDSIRDNGLLTADHPVDPNVSYSYKWEASADGENWEPVIRRKITGDMYNMTEDEKSVYAAFDEGARKYYRVTVTEIRTVTAPAETIIGTSSRYQVPYYDALQNGNFENPEIGKVGEISDYQPFYRGGDPKVVWQTTASDNRIEFVSVANNKWHSQTETHRGAAQRNHKVGIAADTNTGGTQFAELNANEAGALYQDVLTAPGAALYWHLEHRGRSTDQKPNDKDKMYVLIMPTRLAEENNVTTQAKVEEVKNNLSNYPGATVKEISSDNKAWYPYSGTYSVQDNHYLTRFFFVSGETASGDNTIGNHLDKVWFGAQLPPPNPDMGHLTIIKKVSGLNAEDMNDYEIKVSIRPTSGGQSQELVIKNFVTYDQGNTYEAKGSLQNLPAGNYIITETVPGAAGLGDKYAGPVTVIEGVNVSPSANDSASATVKIVDAKETVAKITNTYTKKTVLITLEKLVAGNMGDKTKKFEFDYMIENGGGGFIQLAHGEQKVIEVPYGARIMIIEINRDGYSTKWTVDGVLGETEYCELTVTTAQTITCTNTKGITIPTAVTRDKIPYMLMIIGAAFCAIGIVFTGFRRRKLKFQDWE